MSSNTFIPMIFKQKKLGRFGPSEAKKAERCDHTAEGLPWILAQLAIRGRTSRDTERPREDVQAGPPGTARTRPRNRRQTNPSRGRRASP